METVFKFRKVATSANDADEAYYVPASKIKWIETAATSVVIYVLGRGADAVEDDTITITCGAADELAIADKIVNLMHGMDHQSPTPMATVGAEFYAGITTIAYAVA